MLSKWVIIAAVAARIVEHFDAWVSNSARVIEVIRDSLLLFGEALAATGNRFALYGFSSVAAITCAFTRSRVSMSATTTRFAAVWRH
ncbi:MAG: hypothetical protein A2143_06010 [Gallionellales bacterium RBG_16_57_15]|nr:MAG: hypothetical protein A2143_06010 [Gallionellales bacterium RBG_16_57_15]